MIDIGPLLAEYGLLAGGGVTLAWAGLWLRRAHKVAMWIKVLGLLLLVAGVGALAGVVDVARLLELTMAGVDLIGGLWG